MSCGAVSSQLEVRYIEEVTPGTSPATGDMQIVRTTGLGGGVTKNTETSGEIRADRQVTDLIMLKKEPNLALNGRFSYETWDELMSAAFFADWVDTDYDSSTNTVDADEDTGTYTYVMPSGHGITFIPGGKYLFAGFATSGNNGVKTVISVVGDVITVEEVTVDELAVADITVKSSVLANGVAQKSYTFEDEFTDVSKTRTRTGLVISDMTITLAREAIADITFNLIGMNVTVGNASVVTGTPVDPNTNPVMNSGDNVADIYEGGALQGLVGGELSLQITNNVRGNNAVGSSENICVANGDCNVTGSLNVYFLDWTRYQKFLDNTDSSLRFSLDAPGLGTYYFNVPYIKFSEDEVNAGGPNQDILGNGAYQGILDPITRKTIVLSKIDV